MTEPPRVEFATGGESYPDGLEWRDLVDYERAILDLLLAVIPEDERPSVPPRVRAMDECGCLEFDVDDEEAPLEVRSIAEYLVSEQLPIQVMLTTRANQVFWLEFHRFGGDVTLRPPVEDFGPAELW